MKALSQPMRRASLALALLACCIPAHAEPVTAVIGSAIAAAAATAVSYAGVLVAVPPVLGCWIRSRKWAS